MIKFRVLNSRRTEQEGESDTCSLALEILNPFQKENTGSKIYTPADARPSELIYIPVRPLWADTLYSEYKCPQMEIWS